MSKDEEQDGNETKSMKSIPSLKKRNPIPKSSLNKSEVAESSKKEIISKIISTKAEIDKELDRITVVDKKYYRHQKSSNL